MGAECGRHRVLLTRVLPAEPVELLRRSVSDLVIWPDDDPICPRFLAESITDRDGLLCLLTDRVDEQLLAKAHNLRVVSNYAVGYDNIDVDACSRAGVLVTNTPGVLTEATADLAFALLLACARRLVEADRVVRSGGWKTWHPTFLLGTPVAGRTLAIVGMGEIGLAVTRRALGFGMRIVYSDPRPSPAAELLGAVRMPLDQLLQRADAVSIHAPLTDATRNLIGRSQLELLQPGTLLVNTARGGIVDEEALAWALSDGPLAAAGLDVFSTEPVPSDNQLLQLGNVVLSPHIGSATTQARADMGMLAVHNLLAALRGVRPPNLVNPDVWDG